MIRMFTYPLFYLLMELSIKSITYREPFFLTYEWEATLPIDCIIIVDSTNLRQIDKYEDLLRQIYQIIEEIQTNQLDA